MRSTYIYESQFKEHIYDLIAEKRNKGLEYNTDSKVLKRFDRFCIENFSEEMGLTKEIFNGWCIKGNQETERGLKRRVFPVLALMKHIISVSSNCYYPVKSIEISCFHESIEELIAEKRKYFFKYEVEANSLYRFESFCFKHFPEAQAFTEEVVKSWLTEEAKRTRSGDMKHKTAPIRHLGEYMCSKGIASYILPHNGNIKKPIAYQSNFKVYIEGLLMQKKSLGYIYEKEKLILKSFDLFCMERYPHATEITKEIGDAWSILKTSESKKNLSRRITTVRQLSKYIHRMGINSYIIPEGIPGKLTRSVPHIYTAEELKAFFHEIDSIVPNPSTPVKHLVLPVIFRIYCCCGLRLSEAINLAVEDVDLTRGILTIRQAKGNKDRLVVLADDVRDLLCKYNKKISELLPYRKAFFPNRKGDKICYKTIEAECQKACRKADIL